MMNMTLLSVVTPLYIYHVCSTKKTFWEEKLTGEESFTLCEFTAVKVKNCGPRNFSKHREIKSSDKYITSDISLKFGSLDKMKITSSNPKYKGGISGEGLITSLGINDKARPNKYKKS